MNDRTAYSWVSIFIIVFFATIVILPISLALWPQERAKWKVAAAANALDQGDFDSTLRLLDEARAVDSSIQGDAGYQWTQLQMWTQLNKDEAVLALVRHATGEGKIALMNIVVEELMMVREFERAVRILREILPVSEQRTAEDRNLFAYTLSLAEVDLEEALQQIDLAISDADRKEVVPTFQDTKAWILYKLQRYSEALPLIDAAVTSTEETLSSMNLIPSDIQPAIQQRKPESTPETDESDASKGDRVQTGEVGRKRSKSEERVFRRLPIFSLAVIRYHRAKILDALSEHERAQVDYNWLLKKGFTDFDDLH